eukprot:m.101279 g.101279  ORF g.101279 m.101279 type:complete len:490 (+) comp27319_c0_seq2:220-1689(+)
MQQRSLMYRANTGSGTRRALWRVWLNTLVVLLSSAAADPRAECYVTTEDLVNTLSTNCDTPKLFKPGGFSSWKLYVNDTTPQQTITGFGAAWTDASVFVFNKLSPSDQEALMQDLFSEDGIHLGLMRHTIGQSDLTPSTIGRWSYDENAGIPDVSLSNFTLTSAGVSMTTWLERMFQVNKNITLLGSVWSPPRWMKTAQNTIDAQYTTTWVNYMVKYLTSFQSKGVRVDAITLQNEPNHSQDPAWTTSMSREQQTQLVRMLQPKLQLAGLATEIWAYDHNTDLPSFPQFVVDNTNVSTVAWHCYASGSYTDRWSPIKAFHQKNPHIKQYMTECWTHLNDPNTNAESFFDLPTFIAGPIQNSAAGAMAWTVGGSTRYDVAYPGGCAPCSGIIQVDLDTKRYVKTQDYYTLGQWSKFVARHALYLPSSGSYDYNDGTGVQATAFVNPNSDNVIVIQNKIHSALTIKVQFFNTTWVGEVPARSVITWIIKSG